MAGRQRDLGGGRLAFGECRYGRIGKDGKLQVLDIFDSILQEGTR